MGNLNPANLERETRELVTKCSVTRRGLIIILCVVQQETHYITRHCRRHHHKALVIKLLVVSRWLLLVRVHVLPKQPWGARRWGDVKGKQGSTMPSQPRCNATRHPVLQKSEYQTQQGKGWVIKPQFLLVSASAFMADLFRCFAPIMERNNVNDGRRQKPPEGLYRIILLLVTPKI